MSITDSEPYRHIAVDSKFRQSQNTNFVIETKSMPEPKLNPVFETKKSHPPKMTPFDGFLKILDQGGAKSDEKKVAKFFTLDGPGHSGEVPP